MLPFLRPKHQTGLMIAKMTPEGHKDTNTEVSKDAGLEAAAADFLRGIEMKDSKKIASALRAAYQILDSEEPEAESSEEPTESDSE